MRLTAKQQEFLMESVQTLGLPARVVNALESRKDVLYVYQLLQLTPEELEAVPNFGKKTMDMIFTSLSKHGFVRAKR